MRELDGHRGSWVGTNGFRLTPTDQAHWDRASADVTSAAAGRLSVIRYSWSHPESGQQEGLLVLARDEDPAAVTAFWGDSFHQVPPKALAGSVEGGVVTLGYTYAGDWEWVVVLDATDPSALRLRMDNVIPESAAPDYPPGAYWAMQLEARRGEE